MSRQKGQLFSRQYLVSELREDSERARLRISAFYKLLNDALADPNFDAKLAAKVKLQLGVSVTSGFAMSEYYLYEQWFRTCELRDLLDTITIIHGMCSDKDRNALVFQMNTIFSEETLPYEVDDEGGVHRKFDDEFDRNTDFVFQSLAKGEYHSAAREFQRGIGYLKAVSPDTVSAVRAVFGAVENIFKIQFETARLGASEIEKKLAPRLSQIYSDRNFDASKRYAKSFAEWVNACHIYRHSDDARDNDELPLVLAVGLVSAGASYLRWLLDMQSLIEDLR